MKHKDLIYVRRDYKPVFILGDKESEAQWKDYIPNENFYTLLGKLLNVLKGNTKNRAIWLQGSYGVGKSHACSTVAHLLFEPFEEVKDYVEFFDDIKLKAELLKLRQTEKYIPVYLVGTSNIPHMGYMETYIQVAIKRRLEELNINIPVEPAVEELKRVISLYETEIDEIYDYYDSITAFIESLNRVDKKALDIAYSFLARRNIYIGEDFKKWIEKVLNHIRGLGYSGIIIFWDEFTTIIDTNINYLEKVQSLAENPYIYLVIVSHRTPEIYRGYYGEDTIGKVSDRFEHVRFQMQTSTTLNILKHIIKVKDRKITEKYYINMNFLLNELSLELSQKGHMSTKEDIKKIFPIHPFTLLLSVHLSDTALSATRSLFDFLFNPQEGVFKNFLEKDIHLEPFITLDYLWDYLSKQIEEQPYINISKDTLITIQNLYTTKKDKLSEEELKVFKTILLLNLMYRTSTKPPEYLEPNVENIKKAFSGTQIESKVEGILESLDKNGVIRKNPDGSFLISYGILPENEVEREKNELRRKYKEVSKIIEDNYKLLVKNNFILGSERTREVNINIIQAEEDTRIPSEDGSSISLFIGFPTLPRHRIDYEKKFTKLSQDHKNKIFIMFNKDFGEKELEDWIDWQARKIVAERHNLNKECEFAKINAEKIIQNYLETANFDVFFQGNKKSVDKGGLDKEIKDIQRRIFYKGPEQLDVRNQNLWSQSGPKLISTIISAKDLKELTDILKGPEREFISVAMQVFNQGLSLKASNVIYELYEELENILKTDGRIGDNLKFLTKPPYGLSDNKVSAFMLTSAIKPFQRQLYKLNGEKPSERELSEFIIGTLKGKSQNVSYRLGSIYEDKLTFLLKDIFSEIVKFREEDTYLVAVRNTIRNDIQRFARPIWSLVYLEDQELKKYTTDVEELKKVIRDLSSFIQQSDESFEESRVKELYNSLSNYKTALSSLLREPERLVECFNRFVSMKIGSRKVNKSEVAKRLRGQLNNNSVFWDEVETSEKLDKIIHELEKEEEKKLEPFYSPVVNYNVSHTYTTSRVEKSMEENELLQEVRSLLRAVQNSLEKLDEHTLIEIKEFLENCLKRCSGKYIV